MSKNKFIKKYNDFLNENSEFSFQQFGLGGVTSSQSGVVQSNDQQLSMDAADQHISNIQNQMQDLQNMMATIFAGSRGEIGSTILDLEEFENIKIIRMYPSSNGHLEIYLYLEYDEEPYYITIEDYGHINGCEIKSDLFNNPIFNTKNVVIIKGILMKVLKEWFRPENGEYRTLKEVFVYDDLGNFLPIKANLTIEVDDVIIEDDKPIIYIKYNNKTFYLTENNYYFFKYWFEPIKKQIFYI